MLPTHRLRALLHSCLLAVLCASGPPVHALDPAIPLDGYRHDRWGEAEGAPRFIDTLAQTADGWLWVAGRQAGLFRFDGVRFHPHETVDGSKLQNPGITVLRPARDGALWIGHGRGGVTVLRGGRYRHLLLPAQTGAVYAIAEDGDGVAWAATGRGLFRLAGGKAERVGTELGYPNARAEYALADGAGRLWAVDGQSLYVMTPGGKAFERVRAANANAMVIEAGDGGIWLVQGKAFARVASPSARRVLSPTGRGSSFQSVFDRDGNLWSGNCPVGVCVLRPAHWRHGAAFTPVDAAERFDEPWQMTSLTVVSMMEGRDGSIWIGTPSGLERLRDQPVHMVPELFDRGKSQAAPALDGGILTVQVRRFDDTAGLSRIAGGKVETLPDPLAARALDRAPDGTLVLAGERGIALHGRNGVQRFGLPPDLAASDNLRITKMVAGIGEFWLWTARSGPWHYRGGRWTAPSADVDANPAVVAADAAGRSYLGLPGNRLRIVDGAGTLDYDGTDGIGVGKFMFIWPGAPLLVSGRKARRSWPAAASIRCVPMCRAAWVSSTASSKAPAAPAGSMPNGASSACRRRTGRAPPATRAWHCGARCSIRSRATWAAAKPRTSPTRLSPRPMAGCGSPANAGSPGSIPASSRRTPPCRTWKCCR
ncbi:ligand-binding sensor domain-containing protein [Pseudoduganella lutea]|uniref:ligand-binding sensor domain-containing protein n=1 Tax=Pseudoduganella lutea TaxID=321985 RepID=UPI001E2C69FC|nr:hypothetical protein [Pseudoduganella lutea]